MDPLRIAARALFAYIFLLVMVRLSGKQTVAHGTTVDFVLALVFGDLVDDLLWAEVAASQFIAAVGTLFLTQAITGAAKIRALGMGGRERLVMGLFTKASVIAIGLVAVGVIVRFDHRTFVPPPESVSEGFVRQLAAGRYDRALPLLSRSAAAATDAAKLEALARELERSVGRIEHIEGEWGEMSVDIAQARARLRGPSHAEAIVTFGLVREKGLWKIDGWTR